MEFRILGPLEVTADGRALDLGGHKQRTLLALLLLQANRVVSSDHLIDALWEEEPPGTAPKALQVHVSQLRKLVGRERLETRAPGYLLRVESDELDLARFERLQKEGRLDEALALWRGTPLADFAYQRFAEAEIARLEELRLACLEERIERDLARGRHAELAGELDALVREHRLRERLRGQLMLALYRSGRQADALDAYQDARAALVDELGIEPGRELRELHQAILEQSAALDLVAEVETRPEPDGGFLVGREAELDELEAGLGDAFAGRGRLFLLFGEPGIGKSRLAEEVASRARARGAVVVVGRCWEAGGAPAYWPWVQAMRAYVRDVDPEKLRAQLGTGAGEIAQIVPELRATLGDLPAPTATESEAARFRLLDSTASFLRAASVEQPLVVVLDDLHAADEPSLLLLQFLAGGLGDSRLLVVGTFRDVDPTVRDPLEATLADLGRRPTTRRISLAGLDPAGVRRFIELAAEVEASADVVAAIHDETEGNPLFVGELVRLLATEDRLAQLDETAASLGIPAGAREVISRRLGTLSEESQGVLVLASVLGREFSLDALAQVGPASEGDLLRALDEAIEERVVIDVPGTRGRLRFSHALIRDALYDALPAGRRMRLHLEVAEALETLHARDLDAHLAELAHHYFAAIPAGPADRAVRYARRAGDRAFGLLAYEEAVRLYGMALTLATDDLERCELLLARGEAQARAGDAPAARAMYRDAAELARNINLPEHLARAALGYGGRIIWEVSRQDDYEVPLLEDAIAGLGERDSTLRVRLLARLGGGPLRDLRFPAERKRFLTEEALEMARRLGDPATLAYAIQGYLAGHHSPDFTPQQLEMATELVEIATRAGDKERIVEGREVRLVTLLELGDVEGAWAEEDAMTLLAEELGQPSQHWIAAVYRAMLLLLEGRLDEADAVIAEARSLGERAQSWNAAVSHGLQLYVLRREQGRLDEAAELVRHSVQEYPTYLIWQCVLANMTAELGHEAEARGVFGELVSEEGINLPFDEEWSVSVALLAETARSLGDAKRAAVLYDALVPYDDRVAVSYPEISVGAVAYYLGGLAATMSRSDDGVRHYEQALVVNERIGARPWLAHTQDDLAWLLLERGEPGDADQADELLSLALATYRELGMDGYVARATAAGHAPRGR
jgi:DNA-binding SARP family transcriptional activator/tetratricopeptide (TPR) repeat protein